MGADGAITTREWVADEARALLARLGRLEPLIVQETMAPAAAAHVAAQRAIEETLARDHAGTRRELSGLIGWLASAGATRVGAAELRRRLVRARLRFNDLLTNLDLFIDALTQRSERDTGIWLAGLDVAAEDALEFPAYYEAPPVLCFLDRGPGAAIRRARTRLPGGGSNPVALIQIPRERMTGSGVAASLAHETGHQAAALLGLLESLRPALAEAGERRQEPLVWSFWRRWISEIVADLWAVARLGPTATLGLMAVLTLPGFFVFRISVNDPHPPPWLRVRLSAALGRALYPDSQWGELDALWNELYPLGEAPAPKQRLLGALSARVPDLVDLLLEHRNLALGRAPLGEALAMPDRAPARLRVTAGHGDWLRELEHTSPSRALAVLGQARFTRTLAPDRERRVVSNLLARWAMRRALGRPIAATANRTSRPLTRRT